MKIKQVVAGVALALTAYTTGIIVGFFKGGRRVAEKVFEITDLERITIGIYADEDGESTVQFNKKTK